MRRQRGFTVIELMIVIGIILILVSMLFLGLEKVASTGRARDTRTALQEAKAMFDTYEQATHLQRLPNYVIDPNFWSTPLELTDFTLPSNLKHPWDNFIDLNGPAMSDPQTQAYLAVVQTVLVMNQMASIPENQKILDSLPPNRVKIMKEMTYPVGSINKITGPIMLDSWGHPIIFVPSGGLWNVTFAAFVKTPSADLVPYRVTSTATSPMIPLRTDLSNRCFFASAGPDGDLGKGDDNLYSFGAETPLGSNAQSPGK